MREVYEAVRNATELAGASGDALRNIVALSKENSGQVQDIARAVAELADGSDAIKSALENVNRIAQDTMTGMRQSSGIIKDLINQAGRLDELIAELRKGPEDRDEK